MIFSNAAIVASLCQQTINPDGGTIACQVRRYLSGAHNSPRLIKTQTGFAFAAPEYQEEISTELAKEVVFGAQQIIALPFQRLSGGQMLNFLSAQAAPNQQYYVFFNHALGFSYIGMSDGKSDTDAILKYHSQQVAKALRDMRHQANAVWPSQKALNDAVTYAPQLLAIHEEQISKLRLAGGPLYKYRVSFVEPGDEMEVLFFDCDAEDYEHAMEQAHSSYPEAVLLHAYEPAAELMF